MRRELKRYTTKNSNTKEGNIEENEKIRQNI